MSYFKYSLCQSLHILFYFYSMEDFERKERRERDKQARAMMAQEKHQEPVPLFGEPVRVSYTKLF